MTVRLIKAAGNGEAKGANKWHGCLAGAMGGGATPEWELARLEITMHLVVGSFGSEMSRIYLGYLDHD